MLFDLPLEQLREYRPQRDEPSDFDAFWSNTLAEARRHPLAAQFEPYDAGLATIESYDVTFAGYGGQPIRGWLQLPAARSGRLPCVVEYIGYGGGRGSPLDWLVWASAGYAHLIMDTRGQGSSWRPGDTPDQVEGGSDPAFPGYMTRGIGDPSTYYYRRVFTDAVRAVEAARSHPDIDPSRIVRLWRQSGRRNLDRGGRAGAGPGCESAGRAVSVPLPPRDDHYRRRAVQRDRRLFARAARQSGPGVSHAQLLRRHAFRDTRHLPDAVLGWTDGSDLSTVDGLRGIQLLGRPEADHHLALQSAQWRRNVPDARKAPLRAGAGRARTGVVGSALEGSLVVQSVNGQRRPSRG